MAVRVRYFGYLGAVLIALTVALVAVVVAVYGVEAIGPVALAKVGLLALTGLCGVLAGFRNPVRERVDPIHLVGLMYVCLGAAMAASGLAIVDDFVHGPLRAVFVFLGLPAALLGVNYLGDGWLFAIDGIET